MTDRDSEEEGEDQVPNVNPEYDQYDESEPKYNKSTCTETTFRLLVCLLVGTATGFVLQKSRVCETKIFYEQLFLKDLSVFKFMMSAIAAGMFSLSLLAMLPITHHKFQRTCLSFYSILSDKGVFGCLLGGWFIGVGMAFSGGDPIMSFVRAGVSLKSAYYTIMGLFIGTVLFGILRPFCEHLTRPVLRSSTNPWTESSYFITALPLVAMFGMLCFAFEILIPWKNKTNPKNTSFLAHKYWPPHVCGALVGLLQVPLVLGAEQSHGGASVCAVLVAPLFFGPLRKVAPYLKKHLLGYQNWWQVLYICGIICGAYLSVNFSGLAIKKESVVLRNDFALIGGCFMAFGVLLSGGAALVHGVTGISLLSILSFITIGAAYFAATVTGLVLRYKRYI